MKRRLLNLLTALSLLLFVAILIAWARAQWACGYLEHMHVDLPAMRDRQAMLWFGERSIALHRAATQWVGERGTLESYVADGRTGWNWEPLEPMNLYATATGDTAWDTIGLGVGRRTEVGPQLRRDNVTVVLPYWLLAALAAAPPLVRLRTTLRRRRRAAAGRCRACGYDLTGNTSGVCPECGFRP